MGALVGAILLAGTVSGAKAQRQSGRVVSDAAYTSPYDAFMKMNRFREEFARDESAADYWGFMESRLGNQAGRILVKRPAKGFSDDAFRGWLRFIRTNGAPAGVGNCTACHRVPSFTDEKKHQIGTANTPVTTPPLRDLGNRKSFFQDGSARTLEAAIASHAESGRLARDGKRADVDSEIAKIALTDDEVRQIAVFIRALGSVDRNRFREYLVDVVVQPVEIDFEN